LYNKPEVAAVPRDLAIPRDLSSTQGLSPTPPIIIIIKKADRDARGEHGLDLQSDSKLLSGFPFIGYVNPDNNLESSCRSAKEPREKQQE
jgi:hypothetical protein